jgi:hypothetical protein
MGVIEWSTHGVRKSRVWKRMPNWQDTSLRACRLFIESALYPFGCCGGVVGVTAAAGEVTSISLGVACGGRTCCSRRGGGGALTSIASVSSSWISREDFLNSLDSLAEAFGEFGQFLGAEEDENDGEDRNHFHAVQQGENRVHMMNQNLMILPVITAEATSMNSATNIPDIGGMNASTTFIR